jgi:periplasmic copper chaperone A
MRDAPARHGAAVAAAMAAVAGLSGCAAGAGASPSIELSTAYVPVPQTPGATVAYVVIRNNGAFRVARGPGASVIGTITSVRIPAHTTMAMRPNGVYMLITGAGPMRGGKDITLTLRFAHAGQVSVVAQVTNPDSGGSSYFLN